MQILSIAFPLPPIHLRGSRYNFRVGDDVQNVRWWGKIKISLREDQDSHSAQTAVDYIRVVVRLTKGGSLLHQRNRVTYLLGQSIWKDSRFIIYATRRWSQSGRGCSRPGFFRGWECEKLNFDIHYRWIVEAASFRTYNLLKIKPWNASASLNNICTNNSWVYNNALKSFQKESHGHVGKCSKYFHTKINTAMFCRKIIAHPKRKR